MAKRAKQVSWQLLLPIVGGVLLIVDSVKGSALMGGPAQVVNGVLQGYHSQPLNIIDELPKNPDGSYYSVRSLSLIDKFIWHHSAWPEGDPWDYAEVHIEEHDWPAIGYHFVIQPDGTLYQTNRLDSISYHCSGQNMLSVGTCLTGDFTVDYPTPAAMVTASNLLRDLYEALGEKPSYGHNVYRITDCPGNLSIAAIESQAQNALV